MSRVLIVTGGSRGIGAEVCVLAAEQGWSVAVNYRNDRPAAEDVVRRITGAGGKAVAVQADVSVEADVARLFTETEKLLGPVNGLVNSAGILKRSTPFIDISTERWSEVFATNVMGTAFCAREAARRMIKTGGGVIVNVSSMASVFGAPGEAVDYAASKGAVEVMTIGLSRELAKHSIRVNAVRPGLIDTDMQADSGDAQRAQKLAPTIPMQRPGRAEEVAEAIVWLLSDKASYVVGAFLTVSGGR